jgi:hypothetical protein
MGKKLTNNEATLLWFKRTLENYIQFKTKRGLDYKTDVYKRKRRQLRQAKILFSLYQ